MAESGATSARSGLTRRLKKKYDKVYKERMAEYGDRYKTAMQRARALKDKPIAQLFELPRGDQNKIKTVILFIERCLALLQPGERLGIVLPEGVFNDPSLAYVREFCENRAYIRAVVSLPQMTWSNTEIGRGHFFRSAKTSSGLSTDNSEAAEPAAVFFNAHRFKEGSAR